jgi:hypothetical protein
MVRSSRTIRTRADLIGLANRARQSGSPAVFEPPKIARPVPSFCARGAYPGYDCVEDKSVLRDGAFSGLSSYVNAIKYSRPSASSGASAMDLLNKICAIGLSLRGDTCSLGVLFLYELLQGSLAVNILPTDDTSVLANLLIRMLPLSDSCSTSPFISLLRLMANNPAAARRFPIYADQRSGLAKLTSWMVASSSWLQDWLTSVQTFVLTQTDLKWPVAAPVPAPGQPLLSWSARQVVPPTLHENRSLLVPSIADFAQAARVLLPLSVAGMDRTALSPLCSALQQPLQLDRYRDASLSSSGFVSCMRAHTTGCIQVAVHAQVRDLRFRQQGILALWSAAF